MLKFLTEILHQHRRYPGAPAVDLPVADAKPINMRRKPQAVNIARQYNTQSGAKQ